MFSVMVLDFILPMLFLGPLKVHSNGQMWYHERILRMLYRSRIGLCIPWCLRPLVNTDTPIWPTKSTIYFLILINLNFFILKTNKHSFSCYDLCTVDLLNKVNKSACCQRSLVPLTKPLGWEAKRPTLKLHSQERLSTMENSWDWETECLQTSK